MKLFNRQDTETQAALNEMQSRLEEFAAEREEWISTVASLEAQVEEAQWVDVSDGDGREQDSEDRKKMIDQARKMYYRTAIGRNAVESHISYGCGGGVNVASEDGDDVSQAAVDEFHDTNDMDSKIPELWKRTLRDGTSFMRRYPQKTGDTLVRFTAPEMVKRIEANPDDAEDIRAVVLAVEGNPLQDGERVPGELMPYMKLFTDSDCLWGRSLLEPVMSDIGQYTQHKRNVAILTKLRTSIFLLRKIETTALGTTMTPSSAASALEKSSRGGRTDYFKLPPAGSQLTAPAGVSYEYLSPNIGAADLYVVGRGMLLQIASGLLMPEYLITGDAASSNYASTLVTEGPWVRKIEELQRKFGAFLAGRIYEPAIRHKLETQGVRAVNVKVLKPVAKKKLSDVTAEIELHPERHDELWAEYRALEADDDNYKTEKREPSYKVIIDWPDIVSRDPEKQMSAISDAVDRKIMSRQTAAQRIGLDWELERAQMEDEQDYGGMADDLAALAPFMQRRQEAPPEKVAGQPEKEAPNADDAR